MKIITLHKPIATEKLHNHIKDQLNPLFHKQRQSDLEFLVENTPEGIKILQPDFYDGPLYTIAVQGDELWITRNENYVDDVNSVTIESILNLLFDDISGKLGTDLVEEG